MNENLQDRLKEFEHVAGVQACALLLPDRTCFSLAFDPAFSTECLQNVCASAALTMSALARQGMPPRKLQWVYEHSLLECRHRSDGVCLMVFCTRKPKQLDSAGLERQFAEFQTS